MPQLRVFSASKSKSLFNFASSQRESQMMVWMSVFMDYLVLMKIKFKKQCQLYVSIKQAYSSKLTMNWEQRQQVPRFLYKMKS